MLQRVVAGSHFWFNNSYAKATRPAKRISKLEAPNDLSIPSFSKENSFPVQLKIVYLNFRFSIFYFTEIPSAWTDGIASVHITKKFQNLICIVNVTVLCLIYIVENEIISKHIHNWKTIPMKCNKIISLIAMIHVSSIHEESKWLLVTI